MYYFVSQAYEFVPGVKEAMLVAGPYEDKGVAERQLLGLLQAGERNKREGTPDERNQWIAAHLTVVERDTNTISARERAYWTERILAHKKGAKESAIIGACDAPACRCGPVVACKHAAEA